MAILLEDKRNIALLVFIVSTLLFGWLWLTERGTSANGLVVTVGDHQITQQDVIDEMKATHGTTVLTGMVENVLMEKYAADHQITVSDSEVDQLQRFQEDALELTSYATANQYTAFNQYLANQGITLDVFRRQLHEQALRIKLLVTNEEMKTTFPKVAEMEAVKNVKVFSLPPRYYYREFSFTDKQSAENAIDMLQTMTDPAADSETVANVAANSRIAKAAMIKMFIPMKGTAAQAGLEQELSGLTPGKCSPPQPVTTKADDSDVTLFRIRQLVKVKPATQPDFDNNYMVVGQLLLQRGDPQIYRMREMQLESKMIGDTDIVWQSSQYDAVKKVFDEKKKKTPPATAVPSAPSAPSAPAGPGVTMPAAQPGATPGK